MEANRTVLQPRNDSRWPRPKQVSPDEITNPRLVTVLKVIWNTFARVFHDPVGMILGSAFLLIMLWGTHGKVELLSVVWKGWKPGVEGAELASRSNLIDGLPWDQEWLGFLIGVILLVLVPVLLITLIFRQSIVDYGLCLPPKGRR